ALTAGPLATTADSGPLATTGRGWVAGQPGDPAPAGRGRAGQYTGLCGAMGFTPPLTPPPTGGGPGEPGGLSATRSSALRTPVLQCRTILRSCGRAWRALPIRNSFFGISFAPGMETISYSFGSRTSMISIFSSLSIHSLSCAGVIVDPAAACCASSLT